MGQTADAADPGSGWTPSLQMHLE